MQNKKFKPFYIVLIAVFLLCAASVIARIVSISGFDKKTEKDFIITFTARLSDAQIEKINVDGSVRYGEADFGTVESYRKTADSVYTLSVLSRGIMTETGYEHGGVFYHVFDSAVLYTGGISFDAEIVGIVEQ